MSAEEYFAAPDPEDYSDKQHLPENLFPHTFKSLFPGDIIYLEPDSGFIAADGVGQVYISQDYQFARGEVETPDYDAGGNVAIMRFYEEIDGKILDGYIVDVRTLEAGDILIDPDADEEAMENYGRVAVLGLIGRNPKNEPTYRSAHREETLEYALQLATAVDASLISMEVSSEEETDQSGPEVTPQTEVEG